MCMCHVVHVQVKLSFVKTLKQQKFDKTLTSITHQLTGHIRDTFKDVADISESLSIDSFSLTKALV